jgi:glutathione S-transferase
MLRSMSLPPVELHTMVPAWGLPTFTPFGLKLIAYMQMARIQYEIVVEHDPRRGPTRKFPWIVEGDRTVGDSALIIDHLVATRGDRVDLWLTPQEMAVARAIRRMVEEGLCFVLLHLRWVDDATFRAATDVALGGMPSMIRRVARHLIRRRIVRDLWGQGILRLDQNDVTVIGRADLDALDTLLGDKPFLLGEQPCSADATVAAFLAVLVFPPLENELKDHVKRRPRLSAYVDRMAATYFAEKTS